MPETDNESHDSERIFKHRNKEYFVGDVVVVPLVMGNPADGNVIIGREDTGRVVLIDKSNTLDIKPFDTVEATITHIAENFSIIYPQKILERVGTPEMAMMVRQSAVDAEPEPEPELEPEPPYRPESYLESMTLFDLEPYAELVNFFARALTDMDHQTMLTWDEMELTVEQAMTLEAHRGKTVLIVICDNAGQIICTPFTEKLLDVSINIPHNLNEALQYYDKRILMVILYTV